MEEKKPQNYYQNIRGEMLSFIPVDVTRVLEIGCGEGTFSKAIKDAFKTENWGIEPEKGAAAIAKEKLYRVIVGSAENSIPKLPDNYFDLVVCNDVLEHLVDPWGVLADIKKKLKKNGFILSPIPNVRNFHIVNALVFGGDWAYTESGILDRTHLRFFTSKSIIDMYESLGYSITSHVGINPMPNKPLKYKAASLLNIKDHTDMQYEQFATLAKKK